MAWRGACDAHGAQRRRWQAEVFALNNLLVCLLLYLTLRCAACLGRACSGVALGRSSPGSGCRFARPAWRLAPAAQAHARPAVEAGRFVCCLLFVCLLFVWLRSESAALCLC